MFRNNDLSVLTGYILYISACSNTKPFLKKDKESLSLHKISTYSPFAWKPAEQ
jgi:hypothetical protein